MVSGATVERWSKRVEAWERSGKTAAVFAAEQDLNPKTLAWWRSQLRRMRPAFVEVTLPVPVPVPPPAPVLAVQLVGRGLQIEVPVGADLAWLRSVVEVLC